MEKIAIISDVHANLTALEAVLEDIHIRGVSRIFCLGDVVLKCSHPDVVIDLLRKNCEVMIQGNCDATICRLNVRPGQFWSRDKIGEERASYLRNLPLFYEFYMSGYFIRLFHASPHSLSHIYNPMFSNVGSPYSGMELNNVEQLFENTKFLGKSKDDLVPDVIGYGHLHTPNIFRYQNKTIFNPGSVGIPIEMSNSIHHIDKTNRFSTLASYILLEGIMDTKELCPISYTLVRLPYNVEKEIADLQSSDMPGKQKIITNLRTACPTYEDEV